jgi:hypothetical protein
VNNYPDFQTVTLRDEDDLKLLLELMGINKFVANKINNSEFTKYWDLSNFKLPELDEEQFDDFFKNWLSKDEYGNLIFLQGLSSKWNKQNHRIVVKEGA